MAAATQTAPAARPVLDPGDILTPQQLADRLQVPKSWVFEQTRQRSKIRNKHPLPCLRLGKYLRFSWTQVSQWLTDSADEEAAAK